VPDVSAWHEIRRFDQPPDHTPLDKLPQFHRPPIPSHRLPPLAVPSTRFSLCSLCLCGFAQISLWDSTYKNTRPASRPIGCIVGSSRCLALASPRWAIRPMTSCSVSRHRPGWRSGHPTPTSSQPLRPVACHHETPLRCPSSGLRRSSASQSPRLADFRPTGLSVSCLTDSFPADPRLRRSPMPPTCTRLRHLSVGAGSHRGQLT